MLPHFQWGWSLLIRFTTRQLLPRPGQERMGIKEVKDQEIQFQIDPVNQRENYNFSAAALESSEISMIPSEDFRKLLYGNRDVSIKFIKLLFLSITRLYSNNTFVFTMFHLSRNIPLMRYEFITTSFRGILFGCWNVLLTSKLLFLNVGFGDLYKDPDPHATNQ